MMSVFMGKSTSIKEFDYHLPQAQIAQRSVEPRDHARLLLLERVSGKRIHKTFYEILDEFKLGDVLVMNQTKVFKARLEGIVNEKKIEVFLLRANKDGLWQSLIKPGKRVGEGDKIDLQGIEVVVKEKKSDGVVVLEMGLSPEEVIAHANKVGEVPIPPYVEKTKEALENYQTVYANEVGSVAAPTAGFHFTEELLEKIADKGVQIEFVTLHVGIGTFRPIKTETIEEHEMHAEFVEIEEGVAVRINKAKNEGRRIIAVGTTSVRSLEGVAMVSGGVLPECGFAGDVNLFISPGFEFQVVDALITNFHLPKSSLLVLVSALAGRESILEAYKEAVEQEYRFFSFGDAMFIR
jgi:S-adenosylmethionine:tRNA ribosyltransferase-isomerase